MALSLNDIIAQFSTATSDANKANQQRFQAALDALSAAQTGNTEAYNNAFSLLDSLGSTSRQNIASAATKAEGAGTQNTISSGLFNTTMLDSVLRDVAAKKQSSLTELEQAIAGQKSGLLTAQAGANTNIAGLISSLYGSAFDNAPDASLWAKLATQAQSTPTGKITTRSSSSNPLSDMTDTMNNTTAPSGTSPTSVMVTGTPSGKTWGNDSQVVDNTPATGGLRWEGNTLTNEPMDVSQPEQTTDEYGGGAINEALGSDWLTSSEGTSPFEDLLSPANPSGMLPENRNDASSLYDYIKNNPNSGIPEIGESYMYKSIWRTMGQDPAIDMVAWSAFMK